MANLHQAKPPAPVPFKQSSAINQLVAPDKDYQKTGSRAWLSSYIFPLDCTNNLIQVLEKPAVFVSSNLAAANRDLLLTANIRVIVSIEPLLVERNIRILKDNHVRSNMSDFFKDLGIQRYLCPFPDDLSASEKDIKIAYDRITAIFKQYEDGNTNILIHCAAGLSRSVSLIAARAAKSLNLSFQEVVEFIATKRNVGIDENMAVKLCRIAGVQMDKPFIQTIDLAL